MVKTEREDLSEELLVRILFTVGECALVVSLQKGFILLLDINYYGQFSPANVTPKIITNVQVLVASAEDLSLSIRARAFALTALGMKCCI